MSWNIAVATATQEPRSDPLTYSPRWRTKSIGKQTESWASDPRRPCLKSREGFLQILAKHKGLQDKSKWWKSALDSFCDAESRGKLVCKKRSWWAWALEQPSHVWATSPSRLTLPARISVGDPLCRPCGCAGSLYHDMAPRARHNHSLHPLLACPWCGNGLKNFVSVSEGEVSKWWGQFITNRVHKGLGHGEDLQNCTWNKDLSETARGGRERDGVKECLVNRERIRRGFGREKEKIGGVE